jgi:lipoyl(octanoyl) transferase
MTVLAAQKLRIRKLGVVEYSPIWEEMKQFVDSRTESTIDEFWVLQHPPVFTLGQAADKEHLLAPGDIPVVQSDRGGQVTYHGPGQLVIYVMVDIKRNRLGPRALVSALEASLVRLLSAYGISAQTRQKAPGVYVNEKKIASLGLRIRKGYSFHGLSLNVDMDLEPFRRINTCGYEDLEVIQLADFDVTDSIDQVGDKLCTIMSDEFGYTDVSTVGLLAGLSKSKLDERYDQR